MANGLFRWRLGMTLSCAAWLFAGTPSELALAEEQAPDSMQAVLAAPLAQLTASAEQGEPLAQFELGNRYFKGQQVPRDLAESFRWYQRAADQGYAEAQHNLGNAYHHGWGVARDVGLAKSYWLKAARQGLPRAQFNIGLQLLLERGVYDQQATAWLRQAAQRGHGKAAQLLERVRQERASLERQSQEATAAKTPATAPVAQEGSRDLLGADWIRAQPAGHRTVQLMADRGDASLQAKSVALDARHGPLARFRFRRDGEIWSALILGVFADDRQARAAIDGLPDAVRRRSPWIRRFADIQRIMLDDPPAD